MIEIYRDDGGKDGSVTDVVLQYPADKKRVMIGHLAGPVCLRPAFNLLETAVRWRSVVGVVLWGMLPKSGGQCSRQEKFFSCH